MRLIVEQVQLEKNVKNINLPEKNSFYSASECNRPFRIVTTRT